MWKNKGAKKKLDRKLYDGVKANNLAVVVELLDAGADPNAEVGKHGMTAMTRAADPHRNREIEKALARAGGKLDKHSTLLAGADGTSGARGKEVRVSSDSAGAAAAVETMSLLARSVNQSLKRKRPVAVAAHGMTLSDSSMLQGESEVDDIELPEAMRAAAEGDKEWEFDRSKLKLSAMLGEGQFGQVWAGEATGIVTKGIATRVAVKQLASEDGAADFAKEVRIMKALSACDRVVRILGVCTVGEPMLMIMELMPKGDLKTALRAARPTKRRPLSPLSVSELVRMLRDIAEGMVYLAANNIVHRDLAARNCLVDENYRVKIGDFGLTRALYTKDYYRRGEADALPVRWMSPEALTDGVFTTAGDVWAYGVVLWEVTSMAKMPYSLWTNAEVYENVVDSDYRLPRPKECPKELYALTELCWKEEPQERIGFPALVSRLAELEPQMPTAKLSHDKKAGASTSDAGRDPSSPAEKALYDNPDAGAPPVLEDDGDERAEPSSYDNMDAGAESDDSFEAERLALIDPATLEPTAEFYRKALELSLSPTTTRGGTSDEYLKVS